MLDSEPSANGFATEQVDLADCRRTEAAVEHAAERCGGIWAVVACAGADAPGRIDGVTAEDWERVVQVNLLGTAAVVRAALPFLLAEQGRIVTVASTLGHRTFAGATAHWVSQFGLVGLVRALTAELRGDDIGVTMLTPGGMQTGFFAGHAELYQPPADLDLCPPDAVAEAVVFALSTPSDCELRELVVTPPHESPLP